MDHMAISVGRYNLSGSTTEKKTLFYVCLPLAAMCIKISFLKREISENVKHFFPPLTTVNSKYKRGFINIMQFLKK